ncbi:MAG: type II toxin-antitoxin system Phd/YefM family antitoxin [Synergistaceae bacterium]|jgi:prevent-host-death family protein|nr:type II toxin-antitoxin system Phd/YefM family antitoxin [Synergistaceae bacterium]
MIAWQTQKAKAQFSELIKMAASAPQLVTSHGRPVVVVVSEKEYTRLATPAQSFLEFMQTSPLSEVNLEFGRDRSLPRDANL